ncbi:hypothetical protein, partial [Polynucleobacter alcilacus]|uniref:hypothetical protein n=1 Tax=Polynucleobacter alcilacus TaxID=1819739 RepID=UPI001C0E1A06
DNAHALLDAGLSFVEGNHVTVDAHSTHLNNSLKDLEKLHVDAVSLAGIATSELGAGFTVDLGFNGAGALHDAVLGGLPNFVGGQEVNLATDINTLLGDGNFLGADANAFARAGIDEIRLDDLASAHHTSLDSLFNGTDFNGASLASLGAATSTLRDNGIDEV